MRHLPARLACLLALVSFGFGECQPQDAMSLVAGGFTLITPPSNLVMPGAVVMMVRDEMNRAQLQTVCGPRASLSASYYPRVSETLSASYKMSRSQRLSLQADAVDRFRARVRNEDVETVTVELSRPKIIEIAESDVYTHIEQRTEACQRAIDSRLEAGFVPTFVTAAYIADVEYTVTFKRDKELTKRVRQEKMAQIAAHLGGGHTEITSHNLRATNLVLAIRADTFLLAIRPSSATPSVAQDKAARLDAPVAEVLPTPLVDYVPPAGGWVSPIIGD